MSQTTHAKDEATLLAVNGERIGHLVSGDYQALSPFVGDDLIYISPGGETQDKAVVFEGFLSGRVRVVSMTVSNAKARIYGDMGLVGYRADSVISDGAHRFEGATQSTAVYQHRDGRWVLVNAQGTPIKEE